MNNIIIKDEILKNEVYYKKLDSGLNVYVSPQKNQKKSIGMFGTKFGSVDNKFILNGNEESITDGVAHFLEHKLFEQEEGSALELFDEIGMNSNAYTSYDHTVYYFETVKDIELGIKTLIKLVRTPYFTDENVEKEKGIIAQEIKMYDDNPAWQSYSELLKRMYTDNAVKIDIAGTEDSIKEINKELLYKCYDNFYNLDNMFFIVVGNVSPLETIKLIEDELKKYYVSEPKQIKKIYNINDSFLEGETKKKMSVYMPIVSIGIKLEPLTGIEALKRELIFEIISSMYFGKNSELYNELYNKKLINNSLDLSIEQSKSFAFAILSVQTQHINDVKSLIFDYFKKISKKNIDKNLFEIIKREKYGELVYFYENPDSIWKEIIQCETLDIPMFQAFEELCKIDENDLKKILEKMEHNCEKFMSIIE